MPDRETWLAERRHGIGGSDAAAAMGKSPWKDRLTLWSEKVGLLEPDDLSDNEAVESGIELEDAIGRWYGKRFGRNVEMAPPFTIIRHPEHDFMRATLDARQEIDGVPGVVQIKNTGQTVEQWEDEVPIYYEIQLQHEMYVAGVECGTLVALHRGQKLRAYDRVVMPSLVEEMIAAETEFWNLVKSQTPPEAAAISGEAVKALYPRSEIQDLVPLPPDIDDLDAELQEVKAQVSQLSDRRSEIENQIKMLIGKHEGGVTPQGVKFSWRGSSITYKPQEARTSYVRRFTRSVSK